jgi:voltage-gated potassium channel
MEKVNIKDAASVFVNFEDDTKTLVHLINIRKKHPGLNYVVSLDNPNLKETFTNIGSTFIVSKSDIAAKLVASSIFEPDVASFAEDLISYSDTESESDIQEYKIIDTNPYINKNYMDVFVDLKQKHNSVLIGLAKYTDGKMKIFKNPSENLSIGLNDFIIIISDGGVKPLLEKAFGVKEGRRTHDFS